MRAIRRAACAILSALALMVAGTPCYAQSDADSHVERLESVFASWVREQKVEKAVLVVAASNRILLERGYGGQDPRQRVLLASLSKPITGRCIANLIIDGRLRLETKIGDILAPFFSRLGQPADPRVTSATIAQLLDHQAGFAAAPRDLMTPAAILLLTRTSSPAKATAQELLAAALSAPLAFAPGTEERYSNIGYLTLGVVVELITGQSYEQYCGASVLEPVGISAPRLDAAWQAFSSFGGWSLSGAEYLRFFSATAHWCDGRSPDLAPGDQSQIGYRSLGKWKWALRCDKSQSHQLPIRFRWLGLDVTWTTNLPTQTFPSGSFDLPLYGKSVKGSWGVEPNTVAMFAVKHDFDDLSWFVWFTPRPPEAERDRLFDSMVGGSWSRQ